MGLRLNPEEVKKMASDMKGAISSYERELSDALPIFTDVAEERGLDGVSYSIFKSNMDSQISIIQRLIDDSVSFEGILSSLPDVVGSEILDEDELNRIITSCDESIRTFETQLDTYKKEMQNPAYVMNFEAYGSLRITLLESIIESFKTQKRQAEEKLQNLYRIDAELMNMVGRLSGLFSSTKANAPSPGVVGAVNPYTISNPKMMLFLSDEKNWVSTSDGFAMMTLSLSAFLEQMGIKEMDYDDWHVYRVRNEDGTITYGLVKMCGSGDPGVSVSFNALDLDELATGIALSERSSDSGRNSIEDLIANSVDSSESGTHNKNLTDYFSNPENEGTRLIWETYTDQIASGIDGNEYHIEEGTTAFQRIGNPEDRINKQMGIINDVAGYPIYDFENHTITIDDPENLTECEREALALVTTGNPDYISFEEEVEFHSNSSVWFSTGVVDLNSSGWYRSAKIADMRVDDKDPWYSDWYYHSPDVSSERPI